MTEYESLASNRAPEVGFLPLLSIISRLQISRYPMTEDVIHITVYAAAVCWKCHGLLWSFLYYKHKTQII